MNFISAFRLALKGIVSNKIRTFLTMLGVIIGVSAVIILVSVGKGATAEVTERISSMGSNLITVNITGRGAKGYLTNEEVQSFSDLEAVAGVAPVITQSVTLKYGTASMDGISLEGVNQDYQNVREWKAESGRFVMPVDLEYRQKVAVIGTAVVEELFANMNPIGEDIEINGIKFQIIGILEEKGSSGRENQDEKVMIPLSTAQRLFQSPGIRSVYIQADSPENVDTVMTEVENYLVKIFRDTDGESFRIFNQAELLSTINETTQTLTMMLGGIAGISLLVGGIGIMNIMLVTVTERTREIGIRKSIGAKRRDILSQFLIESVVISGMGGIIGILAGWGGSKLLSSLTEISTQITFGVVLMAFAFSAAVGIFFGIYPANKAAKLKPIEALRFE